MGTRSAAYLAFSSVRYANFMCLWSEAYAYLMQQLEVYRFYDCFVRIMLLIAGKAEYKRHKRTLKKGQN